MAENRTSTERHVSDLENFDTIILKFMIPEVSEPFKALRSLSLSESKRTRKGRVPNGEQVIENAEVVSVETLLRDLESDGFGLYDVYARAWKVNGLEVTVILCNAHAAVEEGGLELLEEEKWAVEELFSRCWSYAHAWENPDFSLSAVFITPRKPGTTPRVQFHAENSNFDVRELAPIKKDGSKRSALKGRVASSHR